MRNTTLVFLLEPRVLHLSSVERKTRLKLATHSLEGYCSINWATSAKIHRSEYASLISERLLCNSDGVVLWVGRDGFEPPKACASRFTVCPIWPLWYLPEYLSPSLRSFDFKSRWRDSNPRPADYKSAALANWATSAFLLTGAKVRTFF